MYGSAGSYHRSPSYDKRKSSRVVLIQSSGRRVLEESRARILIIMMAFGISFLGLAGRLIDVSVLEAWRAATMGELAGVGAPPVSEAMPLHPRADIVDRHGEVLATTLRTASLFANPKVIRHPKETAEKLVKILPELNRKTLEKDLSNGRSFVWIKRHLSPRQQQKVNDLGIPGLNFETEYRRIYPHANMLAHVLGYVDVDTHGLGGAELAFEKQLKNIGGQAEPVQLSVDMRIQGILHEELSKGMEEFQGIGATGVVMDVHTGEVLAMVSLPDFDPHEPGKAKDDARFNRATLGVYEMGSTFKTFTMAAAFDAGTANMHSSYDATEPIRVARFTINDSHPENRWLTVPEIFALSSNIGTVKMVQDVGTQRQRDFLGRLGMLEPVDFELSERAAPLVPNPWREINTMTISYGHGIAVTPMHLVRAIASITGDGKLLPVTFRKDGNREKMSDAPEVLKESHVVNLRKLLRLVVEHGTGSKADAEGYRVGGKTGTAEKPGGAGGRYSANRKLASFVGVFPMDNPRYAVLAMIDEPKGNKSTWGYATGGWVAAPVVKRVVSRMGPLLGIRPIYEGPTKNPIRKKQPNGEYHEARADHAVSF